MLLDELYALQRKSCRYSDNYAGGWSGLVIVNTKCVSLGKPAFVLWTPSEASSKGLQNLINFDVRLSTRFSNAEVENWIKSSELPSGYIHLHTYLETQEDTIYND